EAEAVLQDFEHAFAVDAAAGARMRLEDQEDDVLLARTRDAFLDAEIVGQRDQRGRRLALEFIQVDDDAAARAFARLVGLVVLLRLRLLVMTLAALRALAALAASAAALMARRAVAAVAVAVVRARLAIVALRRIAAGSLGRIVVAALLRVARRALASLGTAIGTGFG